MRSTSFKNAGHRRIDWPAIKDQVDIEIVAQAMLGPPAQRQGDRLLWVCPFHPDHNPSLSVSLAWRNWKCFGCGEAGDSAKLVMKTQGVAFPEAIRIVAELCSLAVPSGMARPPRPLMPARTSIKPSETPEPRAGLAPDAAHSLAEYTEKELWGPHGRRALDALRSRGLTDETIRTSRLGFVSSVDVPRANRSGWYKASGIVIPWYVRGRLVLLKIRQSDDAKPKYVEAFRDSPRVFPGPEAIRPGFPLAVCEGEFDALLLDQQIGDLASVVTLGGASSHLDTEIRRLTRACPLLFTAHDADAAGDKAASSWPARAIRVRPPEGCKDWTDVHTGGFSRIRYLWGRYLPMSSTWERLAEQRWVEEDGHPEDLGCVADEMIC